MKRMKLNKKQKKEFQRIVDFFLECLEPISHTEESNMVAVKLMSRLGCFADRLTYEKKD